MKDWENDCVCVCVFVTALKCILHFLPAALPWKWLETAVKYSILALYGNNNRWQTELYGNPWEKNGSLISDEWDESGFSFRRVKLSG